MGEMQKQLDALRQRIQELENAHSSVPITRPGMPQTQPGLENK